MISNERDGRAIILTLIGVSFFGLSPILLTIAAVPGVVGAVYRVSIPLAVYAVVALSMGGLHVRPRQLYYALGAGLAFGANIGLFYSAITRIGPALASFLSITAILWVGAYWTVFARERLPTWFWLGTVMMLVGVAGLLSPRTAGIEDAFGVTLALGAGISYATFVIISGEGCRKIELSKFLFYSHLAAAALLGAVAYCWGYSLAVPSVQSLLALSAIGIVSQCLGMAAIVISQRTLAAPRVSAILTTEPIFTLIFAALILNIMINFDQLIYCVLLLSGALIASYVTSSTLGRQ